MATPTRVGTDVEDSWTEIPSSTRDTSYTVNANATVIGVLVGGRASAQLSGVDWIASGQSAQALTKVRRTGADPGSSTDMHAESWKLINPTHSGAGVIRLTFVDENDWDGGVVFVTATQDSDDLTYAGVEADNTNNSQTAVLTGSNGTSGNLLLAFGVGRGGDLWPVSADNGFTEIADFRSGTNIGADWAIGVYEKAAPDGCTITFNGSDENAAHMLEWNEAASGTTYFQTVAATAVATPTLTKQTNKQLPVTVAATPSLIKKTSKSFQATAAGVAALTKKTSKTLSATATGTATLTPKSVFTKLLGATATGVATLSNRIVFTKTVAATALGVATLTKKTSKLLSVTATGVAGVTKKTSTTLAATATGVAGLLKRTSKTVAATATGAPTLNAALVTKVTLAVTAVIVATLSTVKIVGGDISTLFRDLVNTLFRPLWRLLSSHKDPNP